MTHTPGPWKIDSEDARVISTLDGDMVAVCEYISEGDGDLISAAPEILEALESMVDMVEMNGFLRDYAMEIAREAIKKARGEE